MAIFVFSSCTVSSPPALHWEEEKLGTSGQLAKYHRLLLDPFGTTLSHSGLIIGIEKSRAENIGYPEHGQLDETRIVKWKASDDPVSNHHLSYRNRHMKVLLGEGKKIFISHVLSYQEEALGGGITVRPVYSAYEYSQFPKAVAKPSCPIGNQNSGHYDKSWLSLGCIKSAISKQLDDARKAKVPFSHVFVLSMGWNNDQVESIRRYNAIIGRLKAIAATDHSSQNFKPLVVGITWPSVWSTNAWWDLVNKALHIGSYTVRSGDADEIGYTVLNEMVNRVVPEATSGHNVKTVLLGHSMGARLLSRALFSGHLLKSGAIASANDDTLMIGLQGAFSIRRFKEGPNIPIPIRWVNPDEGSPYLIWDQIKAKLILTWSEHDSANPMAQFFSGAAHVGGENAVSKAKKIPNTFQFVEWSEESSDAVCTKLRRKGVGYVDASSIIENHNDILDMEASRFIWAMLKCFP